ncbi:transposase [Streptomyces sp. NPDC094143]|uniref:transposase n=1 Tax=Streptomyces sp. NPDC094143 TaxID=3155310 RepID=UPI00331B4564
MEVARSADTAGRDGTAPGEDRRVINGMVYKIRTGISWRDLPERYGPWQTVYTRFRRCAIDGVFHPGPAADPGPGRRRRAHRLAGPDRLHHRPCSSARRRHRPKKALATPSPCSLGNAVTACEPATCSPETRPLSHRTRR